MRGRGLFRYSDSLNDTKQMVVISSLLHLTIIGLMILLPTLPSSRKKIIFSPVYTVDLVELPFTGPEKKIITQKTEKKGPKVEEVKKRPKLKSKPKKIKNIVRPLKKKKTKVKKITELKKGVAVAESKLLAELKALEDKWNSEKGVREEKKVVMESNILEELNALEKKWAEEEKRKEKVPEPVIAKKEEPISSLIFKEDMNAFPYPEYLYIIEARLNANWRTPLLSTKLDLTDEGKKVIVSFKILKDGKIQDPLIKISSGNIVLDRLAIKALNDSDPLPPLPSRYNKHALSLLFGFVYSTERVYH
ncbi:MAG: energy transducer TonB [Nitrospinota bacterium]